MLQTQLLLKVLSSIILGFSPTPLAEAFLPRHGATWRGDLSSALLLQSSKDAVTDRGNTGTSALYEPPSTPKAVTCPPTSPPSTSSTQQPPSSRIQKINSLDEFIDLIDGAPKDSLVAVKFYGKSCPLCRKISIKYQKMARFYQRAPIKFVKIEKTVHPELFDKLEITTFPYLQLYRNEQCIASHATVSEGVFERIVNDTVQQFLGMSPQQWENFLQTFAQPIGKATGNYEAMREIRDQEKTNTMGAK